MTRAMLHAAFEGSLHNVLRAEARLARQATAKGLAVAGKQLKEDLADHTKDAGLGRLSRRWTYRVNRPKRFQDMSVAIFPRGKQTRAIIDAFNRGAVIRPTQGRFLAVPTDFNRAGGRKGGKVLVEIQDIRGSFVRPRPGGGFYVFAPVQHFQQRQGSARRIVDRAAVNDRQLFGRRTKLARKALDRGAVPLFVLLPQVRLSKRLDIDPIVREAAEEVPLLIAEQFRRLDREQRANAKQRP